MTALWMIVLCGALSIVYAIWATASVLKSDAGSARMQEIAAAVAEGAQAYLKRQYMTIGMVGVVIFALLAYFLGMLVAVGFLVGAALGTLVTARDVFVIFPITAAVTALGTVALVIASRRLA